MSLKTALTSYLVRIRGVNTRNLAVWELTNGGLGIRIQAPGQATTKMVDISPRHVERFYVNLAADGDVNQVLRDIVAKIDAVLFPPPPPKPLRRRIGAGKRSHTLTKRQWLGA
jgi:hypothetical protein